MVGPTHSCIFRFGARFGLAIGMVYFGTGQYWRLISGLPLYILMSQIPMDGRL